ncbi:hypothetical protein [Robertkochia flava]|uniref:hypothetical protein n=1 Tax=Robertkochia flava TaxID=3447986 RepID=UPI001CC9149A|nr:hypothetical protein [Robertkochia marina]
MQLKSHKVVWISLLFVMACKTDPESKESPVPETGDEKEVTTAPEITSFSETYSMNGTEFTVTQNGNVLVVTPSGLEIDNSPLKTQAKGVVVKAEAEDLDSDGWPELVVYTQTADEAKKGNAFAYSVLNGKSLTPVYLPPMEDDPDLVQGYVGGDEFAVVETSLVRRFILSDGSTRQIQYKLKNGENSKIFFVDKVVEY